MSLKEECANGVIYGTKHAFRFTVLLRSVRARETHMNAMSGAKIMKLGVVKFFSIVTVKSLDIFVKLIFDISTKYDKYGENIRFVT